MKRVIALVLGLLVLAAAPSVGQQAAPPKEEVVYAHMGADGRVDRVYVVNAFPEGSGRLVDHGNYDHVINLTNTDHITLTGDRVEVNTEPGDFYYQGELVGSALPWLIDVEYVLDGNRVASAELQGASGELEIRVSVRANRAVDPVFFENYMLQISVNLDTQYFSQIASGGATIASNGQTKVVNLTSLPGKESSYVITTLAKNAHVGQIQVAGLPYEMFIELPDPAAYVSDLVVLQDAIAKLADGVGSFTSGVDELAAASGELSNGAATLADGASEIASGFDSLAAGRGDFDAGLRLYNDGIQEFAGGMTDLAAGIGAFTAGIDQLAGGSTQLSSGLQEYSAGMGQFSAGLNQTAQGGAALTEGVAELSEGLRLLTEQGKYSDPSLVSGSAQILQALEMLDAALSFPLTDDEADLLLSLLQDFSGSFATFATTVESTDFDTFLTLLRDSLARFDTSIATIEQIAANLQDATAITAQLGIDVTDNPSAQALLGYMAEQGRQLDAASAELRSIRTALNGLDPLVEALMISLSTVQAEFDTVRGLIDRLNGAIQSVTADDIRQLKEGIGLLSSNYRTFHEGLGAYVDGVEQAYVGVSGTPGLLDGAQQLGGALGLLAASGEELADGASELAVGAAQLDSGIAQLQVGAGQFASQAGLIVDGAGQLADGGNALVSGHGQLLAGDDLFGSGLHDYASGIRTYSDGSWQFSDGMALLGSGGSELSSGAGTLRDETSDMDQQMKDKIDEAMADFLPSDYTLISFTSPKNTGIERVQFVFLTDAQTEQPPAETDAQPEPPKSLWDRILDLFR